MKTLAHILAATALLTTSADAALWIEASDITVEPGEIISISVYSDTDLYYGAFLCIHDDPSSSGNQSDPCARGRWTGDSRMLPGTGTHAASQNLDDSGIPGWPCWWVVQASSSYPVTPLVPGEHFQVEYQGLQFGPDTFVGISLYEFSGRHVLDTLVLDQTVPEPTSLALLGSGAILVLRRRLLT